MPSQQPPAPAPAEGHGDFLAHGGATGALLRQYDWSTSPLGPPSGWPAALRTVIDLILDSRQPMVVAWGPELGILYNDAYGEVLRARHPRALGQPFQQVWSEIWDEILPLIRRTLAGKATLADNLLLATERNGRREESWYDFSFSPLRDAAGQVIGLFCVCAETTWRVLADRARAETEAALRESENRFRSLADDAPVMIWTTDATGHCIWFNRRWIEFTGRDAQNDLGFGWLAAAHPEDHARAESTFIAANASAADFTVEYRLRHRHGDWRWVLATAAARRGPGGEFLGYIGSVIDISERHAAEVAAHALNDALEARVAERTEERDRLWRISRDLMVVADFDGGVRAVNPAWTAVLGWTKAELHRTNLFTLLHPDDLGPARQETARLAAGHTTRHFETRCRHKDGNWRWISWMAAAEEGLVHGVGRDVTAEREATEALRATEEQLRQAQKMEALGQLTGGIAHDFNNLLTGIIGSLTLMQRRVAAGRAVEAERYVEAATQSARRAAALTQRLLAFARRQPLDPRPVDAARLLEDMAELLRRTIGPAIALEIGAEPGIWPILCDPSQLENVVLNLAINARDAMPDGGHLCIGLRNASLPAGGELAAGDYLCLDVIDTGAGMTPAVMARAFDPFFTTKPIGQGTGLGLSMVYGFARQSGGVVRLHSRPEKGTTVTLLLPRHRGGMPAEPALATAGDGQCHAQGNETVLVVEDEAVVLDVLTEVLHDLGYRTLHATDGPAGLEILRGAERLDLLVTDVGLPGGMNGRQLADQARLLRPGLKVLFVTGYAEAATLGTGSLEPGMALLTKPFSVETLAERIRDMVGGATRPG
ncbi:PAS domain S-box protein [Siccirubricoccus deserti]|uniref:histidine kinase n=2 Tax=Siccirubricoccus deserti TaxID=2013562 RepID=A0A9X0QWV6_9PROT|nr:PAS domain S-box protein [Siccirubricoccus deserti]